MKQLNKKKLIRQLRGVVKWKQSGAKGTLEWSTGVGKSIAAILAIKKLQKRKATRTVLIVVPKIELKKQWQGLISKFNIKHCDVIVVNTLVKAQSLKYNMLVLDEIHRYGSDEFSKVFKIVSYQFILGLTATLERLDGKHVLIAEKAPIVDSITSNEARKNGWISDYIEINYHLQMGPMDQAYYSKINKDFHKYFGYFGHDFQTAMSCRGKRGAEKYAELTGIDPKDVAYYANRWGAMMADRKEYLHKAKCKLDVAVSLITNVFPENKIITFGESTAFSDAIHQCTDDSVIYHSGLETVALQKGKEIAKKVSNSKLKYWLDKDGEKLSEKSLKEKYPELTKLSCSKQKEECIRKFKDNRCTTARIIHTAKALDEGFDVEDIEVGIIVSRTSNPTQNIQRVGRIARRYTYKNGKEKRGVIVQLVIDDTQDSKWLKAAQTNPDVIDVFSEDELKLVLEKELN